MRWRSASVPMVVATRAWVSPRVNRAEPWTRGSTPTSQATLSGDIMYGEINATAYDENTGMTDGDGILMANFRADRVREILVSRIPDVPQLRWRLVDVPFGVDRPSWVEDPDLDPDFHNPPRRVVLHRPPVTGLSALRVNGEKMDLSKQRYSLAKD